MDSDVKKTPRLQRKEFFLIFMHYFSSHILHSLQTNYTPDIKCWGVGEVEQGQFV